MSSVRSVFSGVEHRAESCLLARRVQRHEESHDGEHEQRERNERYLRANTEEHERSAHTRVNKSNRNQCYQ